MKLKAYYIGKGPKLTSEHKAKMRSIQKQLDIDTQDVYDAKELRDNLRAELQALTPVDYRTKAEAIAAEKMDKMYVDAMLKTNPWITLFSKPLPKGAGGAAVKFFKNQAP